MRRLPLLGTLVIAAASLACSMFIGGPALPDPPIQNSPEALEKLQTDLGAAVLESLVDGTLEISISQEQLTSYLASWLASQQNPVMTEPQVVLQDGEMIIYGRVHPWVFEANVAATAGVSIGADGEPKISITSAQVGPLPMPPALRDLIAASVDEALTGSIGPAAIGFRLESAEISSGSLSLTGRIR